MRQVSSSTSFWHTALSADCQSRLSPGICCVKAPQLISLSFGTCHTLTGYRCCVLSIAPELPLPGELFESGLGRLPPVGLKNADHQGRLQFWSVEQFTILPLPTKNALERLDHELQRNLNRKSAAATECAFNANSTPHQLNQLPDYGQPKAGSSKLPGGA